MSTPLFSGNAQFTAPNPGTGLSGGLSQMAALIGPALQAASAFAPKPDNGVMSATSGATGAPITNYLGSPFTVTGGNASAGGFAPAQQVLMPSSGGAAFSAVSQYLPYIVGGLLLLLILRGHK